MLGVVDGDRGGGQHRHLGVQERDLSGLERLAHVGQVGGLTGEAPRPVLVHQVLGACVQGHHHDLVLVHRAVQQDHALAFELPCHRTRLGQRTTVLGEQRPDLGSRAVAVVRQRLHVEGHPVWGVALVGDRLVVDALQLTGAPLHRPLDGVQRHRGVPGLLEHGPQRRVDVRVAAALPGRHLHLLDQLGEELAALGVGGTLLVLDGRPLGMA